MKNKDSDSVIIKIDQDQFDIFMIGILSNFVVLVFIAGIIFGK